MRVAVISDIHGNLAALESVLAAVAADRVDELWCLGDLVGYGPRPNACCTLVQERADLCLAGNHDLAVIGALSTEEFSPDAAVAARWSASVLEPASHAFLTGLRPEARRAEAELYHGSPRDPVWDYVLTESVAAESLGLTTAPVVLVGHSHVPLALEQEGDGVSGGLAPGGTERALGGGRWLLNPGSVGQPRDGDPRAAYLLIDFDAARAAFRRVPYPVERTQAEIRERGLPETLAARLAHGI